MATCTVALGGLEAGNIPMSPTPSALMAARIIGVLSIAAGFIVGIYGLERPYSLWLPAGLGLIVTGILAQGIALYGTLTRLRNQARSEDRQAF